MIHGVANAAVRDMDLWSISLQSGLTDRHQHNSLEGPHSPQDNGQDEGSKRQHHAPLRDQAPFIDDELPSAVHAQHGDNMQGSERAGKFTYYFTVGLDAEAAYRFVQHVNTAASLFQYDRTLNVCHVCCLFQLAVDTLW